MQTKGALEMGLPSALKGAGLRLRAAIGHVWLRLPRALYSPSTPQSHLNQREGTLGDSRQAQLAYPGPYQYGAYLFGFTLSPWTLVFPNLHCYGDGGKASTVDVYPSSLCPGETK
jgi:hypothetical protein